MNSRRNNYQGELGHPLLNMPHAPRGSPPGQIKREKRIYGRGLIPIIGLALLNLLVASVSWFMNFKYCPKPPGGNIHFHPQDHQMKSHHHDPKPYDCIWFGYFGWSAFWAGVILFGGILLYCVEKYWIKKKPLKDRHYILISWMHSIVCSLALGVYLVVRYLTLGHSLHFDLYYMHGHWFVSLGSILAFNVLVQGVVLLFSWAAPKIKDEIEDWI